MGGPGVTKCLEIIYRELDLTMAFTGHRDIQDVTKDILYPGTY
jgi:L-lactate dehydrogenase (cytochrome)